MIRIKVIKLNYILIAIITLVVLSFSILPFFLFNFVHATEREGIKVPIIMYHSVLNSKSGKYIISPEELEEDFKYIKDNRYTAVTMTDLINYVYNDATLPEKPIVITFDDGFYNNYYYVIPLLEKYNLKAVISILGRYTDRDSAVNDTNINYTYLRWIDINILMLKGIVEFQNHSYDLHSTKGRNGAKKKWTESLEEYKDALGKDVLKLQIEFKDICNYTPNTFTYPLGAISKESDEILKEFGFKATLGCQEGINYITKDKNCLYTLKRYNRSGNTTTEKFFNKIEKKME